MSQENATLILTQVFVIEQKSKRLCAQHLMMSYTSKGQRVGGAVPKDINRSVFFFFREEIEFVETEIRVFAD